MTSMTLEDKIVVIAGGGGLIGRSVARSVVEMGGTAVVGEITADNAEAARNAIAAALVEPAQERIARLGAAAVNIVDRASLETAVTDVRRRFGKIDGFVNCAYPRNKAWGRAFFDVSYESFCENVSLQLGGAFLASQVMARALMDQGGGSIVHMGSIYGVVAPRFEIYEGTSMTMPPEYAAVKSALVHMTRYIAKYLKGTDVRVNCISPGGILDGQPEPFLTGYRNQCLSKGMLDAADICGAVCLLLSDEGKFINGQNIVVDDGFCL